MGTEIVKVDAKLIKEEKKPGLFDKIKEDMGMEVLESLIPKIKPFLAPGIEKMNEWFGEDEKIIIIKKNKGAKAKVLIFDNNKGEYEIKSGEGKKFTADKDCVIGVYDIEDFMQSLISGDLTKMVDNK